MGGLGSDDCNVDPTFCHFNKVRLVYCDGTSFSGNNPDPVVVDGTSLYFRGKLIMDQIMETLLKDFGLDKAKEIVLTGCSAGGLSTY